MERPLLGLADDLTEHEALRLGEGLAGDHLHEVPDAGLALGVVHRVGLGGLRFGWGGGGWGGGGISEQRGGRRAGDRRGKDPPPPPMRSSGRPEHTAA